MATAQWTEGWLSSTVVKHTIVTDTGSLISITAHDNLEAMLRGIISFKVYLRMLSIKLSTKRNS